MGAAGREEEPETIPQNRRRLELGESLGKEKNLVFSLLN